jgi:hypothetical protein
MRKSVILLSAAVATLAACGQSAQNSSNNSGTTNQSTAAKSRPAYCFFKDSETKDWKGKRDKEGNAVITGKVYREDSRYKAVLGPPTVNGTTAEVAPTLTVNDTGYAASGDWWDVTATIPNSQAIDILTVKCGEKTLATIRLPRKK